MRRVYLLLILLLGRSNYVHTMQTLNGKSPEVALQACPTCHSIPSEQYIDWQLIQAAKSGDLKKVKDALDQNACPWTVDFTHKWWTPLHWAASQGHTAIVKELISRYDDADLLDQDGKPAIVLASQNKHNDIVKLLIPRQSPHYVVADKIIDA
jgi:hypothetical protein